MAFLERKRARNRSIFRCLVLQYERPEVSKMMWVTWAQNISRFVHGLQKKLTMMLLCETFLWRWIFQKLLMATVPLISIELSISMLLFCFTRSLIYRINDRVSVRLMCRISFFVSFSLSATLRYKNHNTWKWSNKEYKSIFDLSIEYSSILGAISLNAYRKFHAANRLLHPCGAWILNQL